MTVDIHGFSFGFLFDDEALRTRTWDVLAAYGFALSASAERDVDGGVFTMGLVHRLPSLPTDRISVGTDNNGVAISRDENRFFLETSCAVFVVDLAAKHVQGSFLAADLPQAGPPLVWLTMWGLNLLLRDHRFFPLHAAALAGDEESGILVTGASGSGKSTLACNLLREGWHFLSDDTVLLHPGTDGIEVFSFRINFSLRETSRTVFPDLLSHGEPRPTGERKHWVPMRSLYPEQAADSCSPRVLVFPELTGRAKSRVIPITPGDALHSLVCQSALVRFRRDWAEEHLALLVQLTYQAPSYRLEAGRDLLDHPERSHEVLAPLLSRHAQPQVATA